MFFGRENPPAASRPPLTRGGFAGGLSCGLRDAVQEPTLIRLAALGTFPLEGGRLTGAARAAPTTENGPGALVR